MSKQLLFSSLLPQCFPNEAAGLFAALEHYGISYSLLDGAKDIWARDYLPVKTRSGRYVSFRYEPSYLNGRESIRTDFRRDIAKRLGLPVTYSDINLDGGNVVFSPSKARAIVSDRVFSENPGCSPEALLQALAELLEAELLIIPSLKSDMTGHADGMVRFLDEQTVLCNRPLSPYGFERRVLRMLQAHGLRTVEFPFAVAQGISAIGCYLNYLETDAVIFLPIFGIAPDGEAVAAAKRIFPKRVEPVMLPRIAAAGGCLNCISWES